MVVNKTSGNGRRSGALVLYLTLSQPATAMADSHEPTASMSSSAAQYTAPPTADPNATGMLDHLIRIVTTCKEQLAAVNDGLERYDHIEIHNETTNTISLIA